MSFVSKIVVLFSFTLLVSGCGSESTPEENAAPPPVGVSVAQVISQRITEWDDFSGRLEAVESVELRPRVSGYIAEVVFNEGAQVVEGDILFKIDPESYQADVDRLRADLSSAESQYSLAKSEHDRAVQLQKKNAIAQELVESRFAQLRSSSANLQAIDASLAISKLNLEYTEVRAPISGRVSNAFFTKGNYVTDGESALTSIVSTDKIYAYFEADERAYLKYAKLAMSGVRPSSRETENPVYMSLADEAGFMHSGHIDFIDNQVNVQTSTVRARAVFDNADGTLIPGLFARIRVVGSASYEGILIDGKAVSTDLNTKYVLVLDSDNVVQYRSVELGEIIAGLTVVKSGLEAGEVIVTRGVQRVMPGTPVTPKHEEMASDEIMQELKNLQTRVDNLSRGQIIADESKSAAGSEIES